MIFIKNISFVKNMTFVKKICIEKRAMLVSAEKKFNLKKSKLRGDIHLKNIADITLPGPQKNRF